MKNKTFPDIDGKPYDATLQYFQPECPGELKDDNGKVWPSYCVWTDLTLCRSIFKRRLIFAYTGEDIQQPLFCNVTDPELALKK